MITNPHASAGDAGDRGLIPGLGRSPVKRNGNPLQYSCLENPVDRGAWWATVHGGHKESGTAERLTRTRYSFWVLSNTEVICLPPLYHVEQFHLPKNFHVPSLVVSHLPSLWLICLMPLICFLHLEFCLFQNVT